MPSPPPGDLPEPGITPRLLHLLHWEATLYYQSHLGSQKAGREVKVLAPQDCLEAQPKSRVSKP